MLLALIIAALLLGGCQGVSYTVTVETPKVKAVVVVPVEVPEPFDICAPTDGETSPLRLYGHAMDSKPYGCM